MLIGYCVSSFMGVVQVCGLFLKLGFFFSVVEKWQFQVYLDSSPLLDLNVVTIPSVHGWLLHSHGRVPIS